MMLADHIVVQDPVDFTRRRQRGSTRRAGLFLDFLADNVVTQIDTFVTDKYGRPRDQFSYFMLALAAKGAAKIAVVPASIHAALLQYWPLRSITRAAVDSFPFDHTSQARLPYTIG